MIVRVYTISKNYKIKRNIFQKSTKVHAGDFWIQSKLCVTPLRVAVSCPLRPI